MKTEAMYSPTPHTELIQHNRMNKWTKCFHAFIIISEITLIGLCASILHNFNTKQTNIQQKSNENQASLKNMSDVTCDVAIIGAGVGGLWVANRLQQTHFGTICVFEALTEVGGRLRSRYFDGADQSVVELGGMQIHRSQKMIFQLVQQLRLPLMKREDPSKNFLFLRNRRVKKTDWGRNKTAVPYFFNPSEFALLERFAKTNNLTDPSDFLHLVFEATGLDLAKTPNWTYCDWENWKQNSVFQNSSVKNYNIGWWYALQQVMSDEAVVAYRDTSGYDSFLEESNSADVLSYVVPWYNSPPELWDEYRILNGYQQVPDRLNQEFLANGGSVYFDMKLVATKQVAGGKLQLQFANQKTVTASHVVYTMTQSAIVGLADAGPSLSTPTSQQTLRSVSPVRAFKLFLAFSTPWWTKFGFTTGVMALSSPARKIYYWSIEASMPGGNQFNNNSVLMATYDDDEVSSFWANMLQDYEHLVPFYFEPNPHYTSPHSYIALEGTDPRAVIVREAMRQIRTAHSDQSIPNPFAAVFADWNRAPSGGAWHSWNIGVVSRNVRANLRTPTVGNTVVCGETFSDLQGWVEGALRSCEKVLIDYFGISSDWQDYVACA